MGHSVQKTIGQASRRAALSWSLPTSRLRTTPNFLIVGAQRCGTTSLFRWLARHPTVIAPLLGLKGVHYFDTGYGNGWEWYRAHFPTVAYEQYLSHRRQMPVATGEASPYYMFHPLAPERIARVLPDVKLIILLRDPVDRAYSHYQHMVFEGWEELPSFEEAIRREPERLAGEEDRILAGHHSLQHQHHSYLGRGNYIDQILRLRQYFRPEQLLILISEQVFADASSTLPTVYQFLGLPPAALRTATSRHNSGRYPPMKTETRERLASYFEESNARLASYLGFRPAWQSC